MTALALAAALVLFFGACQGSSPAPLPEAKETFLDSRGEEPPQEAESPSVPDEGTKAVQEAPSIEVSPVWEEMSVPAPEHTVDSGTPSVLAMAKNSAPPQTAEERQQAGELLAPQVEKICRSYGTTGMTLVVFDEQGPFYSQSWGWAVKETGQPAAADTIYRIASISKAVSGLLALDLAEEGKLDLHGDLTGILGIPVNNPGYPEKKVTPWHLLTHTSGIVDSQAYLDAITSNFLPPLEPVLSRSFSGVAPGTCYCYSNLGMGLMTGVIESSTGERFLEYTGEKVFRPMGIDAAYSYTDIRQKEKVANIYAGGVLSANMPTWKNMSDKYTCLPMGQTYALAHGDLFISAPDLCRFARILAGCPQEGEVVSLSPEYLRLAQEVQYREGEGVGMVLRGLGTQITDQLIEGRRMVGHQGNAYGSICGMFVDPADHTGFVFLTNGVWGGKDEAGIYYVNREIAQAVYGAFFGEEPVG